MHKRYQDPRITNIWSDEHKFELWQKVELAFLDAQISEGNLSTETVMEIDKALLGAPIDVAKIDEFEKELRHDLNAFVKERRQHLPADLQGLLHKGNTSYDTEEPAMALMLIESYEVVREEFGKLQKAVFHLSDKHRYTLMFGRTHGQEAEVQTFGKRCRSWLASLNTHVPHLITCRRELRQSKFSGAIGNYTTVTPKQEAKTLENLELTVFHGATQIIPRELYSPLADVLARLCFSIEKIAIDLRLSGRSGRPLCHEPFGKGQMGSSAMPHKKNNIITEQLSGMSTMADGFAHMIRENIITWEERAIEQSCVERVAWPDLFHVTVHGLKRLTYVIDNLVAYPQNMLLEIKESGGLYASNEAKQFLFETGEKFGLTSEDAYRIVQLAAFNFIERKSLIGSYTEPKTLLEIDTLLDSSRPPTFSGSEFKEIIPNGQLEASPQLQADATLIEGWNSALLEMFHPKNQPILDQWWEIFLPSRLLRHEKYYFDSVGIAPL